VAKHLAPSKITAPRVALMTAGAMVLVGAFLQQHLRDTFATFALVAGVFLLVAGALPIRKGSIGPEGATVEVEAATRAAQTTRAAATATEITRERADGEILVADTETVDAARFLGANAAVAALLNPETGPLAGMRMHLFLYDAEVDRLMPVFEPTPQDPQADGWMVGRGVTGRAYELGEYVVATGAATHDATYGLNEEEQAKFASLRAVAAMPVMNADEQVIGVLSCSSIEDVHLEGEDTYEAQLAVAAAISRILIDLLHWFQDRYDESAGEQVIP